MPFVYFLAVNAVLTIYSRAKIITKSTAKRKSNVYFHFWAFHLFALLSMSYTIYLNYQNSDSLRFIIATLAFSLIMGVLATAIGLKMFDVETPTHCCRCSQTCSCISHYMLLFMSVCLLTAFTIFLIFSIPTIILVFKQDSTLTLAHLPLIHNAVFGTNFLLAKLLFQCERCCHPCTRLCVAKNPTLTNSCNILRLPVLIFRHLCNFMCCRCCLRIPAVTEICTGLGNLWTLALELMDTESIPLEQRADNHNKHYDREYNNLKCLACVTYFCHPIATFVILILWLLYLYTMSELLKLHRDSSIKLLLTSVPNLFIMIGAWYKSGVLNIGKAKSLKESLQKVAQMIKNSGSQPSTPPGSPLEQPTSQPAGMSDHLSTERSRLLNPQTYSSV